MPCSRLLFYKPVYGKSSLALRKAKEQKDTFQMQHQIFQDDRYLNHQPLQQLPNDSTQALPPYFPCFCSISASAFRYTSMDAIASSTLDTRPCLIGRTSTPSARFLRLGPWLAPRLAYWRYLLHFCVSRTVISKLIGVSRRATP